MKLIEQSVELIPENENIYKQIEFAARTCYKSEDKITEDSAIKFVDNLIKRGHLAMLEHGTVYMFCNQDKGDFIEIANSPYSYLVINDGNMYVTTNLRVIYELFPDRYTEIISEFGCSPTKYHQRRLQFKIITSIAVGRELLRHRVFSPAQESTRWCNYSKNKFGNQLTFIKPYFLDLNTGKYGFCIMDGETYIEGDGYIKPICNKEVDNIFIKSCLQTEQNYFDLINSGKTPQEAREVLSLSLKSEVVMTGFVDDWKQFINIRYHEVTGPVVKSMKEIASMINDLYNSWNREFEKVNIYNL